MHFGCTHAFSRHLYSFPKKTKSWCQLWSLIFSFFFRILCLAVFVWFFLLHTLLWRCTVSCGTLIKSPFWWENFVLPEGSAFSPEYDGVFLIFFTQKLSEWRIFKVSEVVMCFLMDFQVTACTTYVGTLYLLLIYTYIRSFWCFRCLPPWLSG